MHVNSVICSSSNNCCIVINQVEQSLYLLQIQHHPLRTKVSLNKTTRIFVPFFFFFFFGYLGSFEVLVFCLIFRLTHVWLLRNEEEVEET